MNAEARLNLAEQAAVSVAESVDLAGYLIGLLARGPVTIERAGHQTAGRWTPGQIRITLDALTAMRVVERFPAGGLDVWDLAVRT
ncbi:MAG TPA: hypothetical protein VFQ42_22515 [Mycobacterium sp.]|nr:hypothetical protein [Mycobacterium sp.]